MLISETLFRVEEVGIYNTGWCPLRLLKWSGRSSQEISFWTYLLSALSWNSLSSGPFPLALRAENQKAGSQQLPTNGGGTPGSHPQPGCPCNNPPILGHYPSAEEPIKAPALDERICAHSCPADWAERLGVGWGRWIRKEAKSSAFLENFE